MRLTAITCSLALTASLAGILQADDQNKQLYADLVAPVLAAKCVACHGEDKQKGKLRVDTVAFMTEGESLVAGKPDESLLLERVYLPLDDDDHMPPEDKEQLTKQETALIAFWIKAGAKEKGTVAEAKPDKDAAAAIAHVAANIPKAAVAKAEAPKIDPAKEKLVQETIGRIEESGASLMAIAQNTPELRYSALNITKEFKDENLAALKPIADQVKWMDLARTGVTDKGLANLTAMKNLTRLHLENTAITDAGLDSLKGLANLEYLNLYGTQVTDAGAAKLAGLKNLKKVFLWQSKVSEAGAKKLAAAIPGIEVNTGWKASAVEPVVLAAATPKPAAKPAPTTPAPKPAAKPAPKPAPTTPKPAAKPTTPAPKPAPKPAAKPAPTTPPPADATFTKALAELKATADKTTKEAATAKAEFDAAIKTVADATKKAEALKTKSDTAAKVAAETKAALAQLEKAAAVKK